MLAAALTRSTQSLTGTEKCIIQQGNRKGETALSIIVALIQCRSVAMFTFRSCCLYERELHVRTDCARTCTVTWPFSQGGFSLWRTALLFDTDVSPSFPSSAGTSVLDTPVEDSCGSSSFFSASVQRFSEQTNIPEYLNYKQIWSHWWFQILLTGNLLQTSCEEINSPDWSAGLMLHLSRLRPHLDVCIESLSRMSQSPKPDRCCRSSM